MSYVTWLVTHEPFVASSGTWDTGSVTTLDRYKDIVLNLSLGEKRDTFQFEAINAVGDYDAFFNPEDRIKIWRVFNSATVDTTDLSNLQMIGLIKDPPLEYTAKKKSTKVEGYNFSEAIAKAIAFVDTRGLTIPVAIQRALDNISSSNTNFRVTWSASNPTLKSDGTAFPTVNERFFYKPFRSLIEKYSTSQYTQDGNYYWYVNSQNELIWRQRDSFGSGAFDETIDPAYKIQVHNDTKNIKNYIVAKGGLDPAGNQIQIPVYDQTSINKHGRKFGVYVEENLNAKVLNSFDLKRSFGDDAPTSGYPDFTSLTFTTDWPAQFTGTVDGISQTEGSNITITGADEDEMKRRYTAIIRENTKSILNDQATAYLQRVRFGKYKADIILRPGAKPWALGEKITCTIPSAYTGEKIMRVTDIQLSTDTDRFSLEEDEGTVTSL